LVHASIFDEQVSDLVQFKLVFADLEMQLLEVAYFLLDLLREICCLVLVDYLLDYLTSQLLGLLLLQIL